MSTQYPISNSEIENSYPTTYILLVTMERHEEGGSVHLFVGLFVGLPVG